MRMFIIECLNPMDLIQGRSEAAALEGVCRLLGYEVATLQVQSVARLREVCKFIASIDEIHDRQQQRRVPLCVHIAAHGNANGIGVGPKTVSWQDLADAILSLGTMPRYSGPLILVLSACDAGRQSLTKELRKRQTGGQPLRLPAYVFVTCDPKLAWTASVAAWTVFYHLVLKAKLTKPEAVKRVLTTVRAAGGAFLRYHRWDQQKKLYRQYEPKPVATLSAP